jgi:RNA polymerase sigma-70 factor (ECF subfamily)
MREDPGDDKDLVERLRAGEPRAFEDLVRRYQHRVFGVALRMLDNRTEAEDIAQDVFLRVHRSIGAFRGEAKLSTWLYGIASNLCLNRLTSAERKRVRHDDEAVMQAPSDAPDATATMEHAEIQAALRQAINELPDERRIVIVLRDLEGLAYEEIALALGLEPGTVRSRLHRARLDLKNKMERFLP